MKDLARWVIEEGLISEAQLAQARKLQGDSGVPLPMALLELRLVEEKRLVDVVSKRTGLAKAPRRMHRMEVTPKALSLVPQDYCWQYNLFPFNIDTATRRLQLAIMDPDDQEALATIRRMSRLEIDLFVAGPKQIEKAIRRHYLDSLIDETNQPAQLRYFGYDNITSPGATGAARPATGSQPAVVPDPARVQDSGELTWEEPPRAEAKALEQLATSDIRLPPPRSPAAATLGGATPIPPLFPPEPQTRRTTMSGTPAAPAAPVTPKPVIADEDLPIMKEPTGAALARVQARPDVAELSQRLDVIEHVLSRLVALLAHDTRDTAGQLARLADEAKGLRRRTPG